MAEIIFRLKQFGKHVFYYLKVLYNHVTVIDMISVMNNMNNAANYSFHLDSSCSIVIV